MVEHGLVDALGVHDINVVAKEIQMSRANEAVTSVIAGARNDQYTLELWQRKLSAHCLRTTKAC